MALALLAVIVLAAGVYFYFPRPQPQIGTRGGPDTSSANYAVVRVFYGTDRKAAASPKTETFYGSERTELQIGTCDVSIPRDHRMGAMERPSVLKLEFTEDPNRHIVIQDISPLDDKEFYKRVQQRADKAAESQAFVFVHGFGTSFAEAARRTAQLSYDLGFDGVPMCFSWPSKGEISEIAYQSDYDSARAGAADLKRFLENLKARTTIKHVHLIAHSMGNQVLTDALSEIALAGTSTQSFHCDQLILAAPDLDAAVFAKEIVPHMRAVANRVTLYASRNDMALSYSQTLHQNLPRAGMAGDALVVIPGIDTIDVSQIDSSLVGHSYYAENESVISDIYALLAKNLPPEKRKFLVRGERAGMAYWTFQK
jgi:esterase/lipase superfamily enzyme